MTRHLLGCLAFGILTVAVACSDDAQEDKYPNLDSFCTAQADTECVKAQIAQACGVTPDSCKAARVSACKSAAGAAVGRTYAPSLAEDCIAKTEAVFTPRVVDPAKDEEYQDACNKVFAGTGNKSDPCKGKYDCSGALICDTDKGFCADKVEKQPNDGCNNPGEICTTGFYCQLNGTIRFCKPKKALGEPCSEKDPCVQGLRCVNTCLPKAGSGENCNTKDDCTSGACDSKSKKCVARLYASENGTCADFGAF